MKLLIHYILAFIIVQNFFFNIQRPFLWVTIYSAAHLLIIFLPIVMNKFFLYVLSPSCDQNTDVLETTGWVTEAAVSSL